MPTTFTVCMTGPIILYAVVSGDERFFRDLALVRANGRVCAFSVLGIHSTMDTCQKTDSPAPSMPNHLTRLCDNAFFVSTDF
jgi:hypothetical protein